MRAQASVEYIAIVFIVIAMLIPIWAYVAGVKEQASTQMSLSYAQTAADRIADGADLVGSQGASARLSVRVYIPYGVNHTIITGNSMVFGLSLAEGYSDVVAVSSSGLNGTLPTAEGEYWIVLESNGTAVNIWPA